MNVRDGVINGIAWDDACLFCAKNQCLENTFDFQGVKGTEGRFNQKTKACHLLESQNSEENNCVPDPEDASKNLCDILVYFVWTGTDSKGLALQSSNSRFSAFPIQEIEDRFSALVPDVNNPLDGVFESEGDAANGGR